MTPITITIENVVLDDPEKIIKLVKFSGQLDETNVDEKSGILYDVIKNLPEQAGVIFDFDELEYLNSKSIGYLTDWYTKIKEKKGILIIARARENIMDVLSVVGVNQIIKITMTLEEAKLEIMKEWEHPEA